MSVIELHDDPVGLNVPKMAGGRASEIIANWPSELPFRANDAMKRHPEVLSNKSIVLELAIEEFYSRRDAGEHLDIKEFVKQFPQYQKRLLKSLEIECYLHNKSYLFREREESRLDRERERNRWPEIGENFVGFRLHDELGRGAFSRVFMASDVALANRKVVLKVCQGGGREAYALGKLQHPNIGPVLSVQEDEQRGLTAICMPFLTTATLHDVLAAVRDEEELPQQASFIVDVILEANGERQPKIADLRLDPIMQSGSYVEGIVRLATQIAGALAYTHRHGILHCDIKPSNVLLSPAGDAILFDYNLSFLESAEQGIIGGTFPYMAPEILELIVSGEQPEDLPIDTRTDIFSLGATLYQLLSGQAPFDTDSDELPREQVAARLIASQIAGPTPLYQINPKVGRRLSDLIQRCLAFDPDARPESADVVVDELQRLTAKPRQRTTGWFRRSNSIASLTLVSLLVVLYVSFSGLPFSQNTADSSVQQSTFSIAASPQSDVDRLMQMAEQAQVKMQGGFYEDAYPLLATLAEQTNDSQTYGYLAYCHCQLAANGPANQDEHLAKAIQAGETAIERGFSTTAVKNNLGYCYRMRGDFDAAIRYLNSTIEEEPECLPACLNLFKVDIALALANPDESPDPRALRHIGRLRPDTADFNVDKARFYALRARYEIIHGPESKRASGKINGLGCDREKVDTSCGKFWVSFRQGGRSCQTFPYGGRIFQICQTSSGRLWNASYRRLRAVGDG